MEWHFNLFMGKNESTKVKKFLNKLTAANVPAENIKLLHAGFTDTMQTTIWYLHTEKIN